MSENTVVRTSSCVVITHTFHNLKDVKNTQCLESNKISVKNARFFLKLFPNGVWTSSENYLELFLGHEGETIKVQFFFRFWRPGDIEKDTVSPTCDYEFKSTDVNVDRGYQRKFIKPDYSVAGNNSLIVECTLKFNENLPMYFNYTSLLFSTDFSDGTIKTEDEIFPIHKMVLGLQSPVFKTMFQSNMLESTTNEVVITDFNSETVRAFLTCLYSNTNDLSTFSFQLCVDVCKMADKYGVERLQISAFDNLMGNISEDSCVPLLFLAEEYSWSSLRKSVLTYIGKNLKKILKSHSNQVKELTQEHFTELSNYM